jgi:glycosyltransferase involved in cell wall biosynthesis
MVVRYHDAIPLLMPHTIAERAHHQASHHGALLRNVRDGAWFACVSEATRRDLLAVHPHAADRAVTIHNMVSHHYFPESTEPGRVAEVLRTRRNARFDDSRGARAPRGDATPRYLLMVSTIEPRKNHLALLSAWEALRLEDPALQLVLVGSIGWESDPIVRRVEPWLRRGGVHLLEDVPATELRLLYRHAALTVCPSLYEGFDFAGVEAMRCGGVVLASDIPVHREIYGEACGYFDPYCVESLARTVRALLAPSASALRERLAGDGETVSARYLPERILPQWRAFLERISVAEPAPRRVPPRLPGGVAEARR